MGKHLSLPSTALKHETNVTGLSIDRVNNPCRVAEKFSQKAKKLGVRIEISRQDLDHFKINKALGKENAYTYQVETFMRSLGIQL